MFHEVVTVDRFMGKRNEPRLINFLYVREVTPSYEINVADNKKVMVFDIHIDDSKGTVYSLPAEDRAALVAKLCNPLISYTPGDVSGPM